MVRKTPNASSMAKGEVVFRADDQLYARVSKSLGAGRFMAMCSDKVERMCKLRGSMRKSAWVSAGTLVLISLREYGDEKADILLKYSDAAAKSLEKYGELDSMKNTDDPADEDLIDFEDVDAI